MAPPSMAGHKHAGSGGAGTHHHHHGGGKLPFQLLEVTVVSAQDLQEVSRTVRAYAVAWVQPNHKLRTAVDPTGHTDPTWNHKFVFRVAPSFLLISSSTAAAVTIDLFAARNLPLRDVHLGTARLLLSSISGPLSSAARFIAVQVRRPSSLRPQGILNLGVALVDPGHARSSPLLYADLPPTAVALPGGPDDDHHYHNNPAAGAKEIASIRSKLEKWREELLMSSQEFERKKAHRELQLHRERENKKHNVQSVRTRDVGRERIREKEKRLKNKNRYCQEEHEEEEEEEEERKGRRKRREKGDGGGRFRRRESFGSRFACFGIGGGSGGGRWVDDYGGYY